MDSDEGLTQTAVTRPEAKHKANDFLRFSIGTNNGVASENTTIQHVAITNSFLPLDKEGDPNPTSAYEFEQKAIDYDLNIAPKEAGLALLEAGLVFISCDDHLLAKAAAYNLIAKNLDLDAVILRRYESLNEAGREDSDESLPEDFSFATLEKCLNKIEENSVVVIDLSEEGSIAEAKQFVAYFHQDLGLGYLSKVSSKLSRQKVKIICLLSEQIIAKTKLNETLFLWQLDAVTELMRAHYKQKSHYIVELKNQLGRQLWGDRAIENVRSSIDRGEFERQLVSYSRKEIESQEKPFEKALSESNPLGELNQYVLYVAAYFPKLSDRFFETVLLALLGDKEATIDKRIQDNAHLIQGNGDQLHIQKEKGSDDSYTISVNIKPEVQAHDSSTFVPEEGDQQTVKLSDVWSSNSRRQSVAECRLMITRKISGRSFISFEEPHLIDQAKAALISHDPFCMIRYADSILASGLIFHQSEDIANRAIELLVEKMRANPEVYNRFWLADLVMERWLFVGLAEGAEATTLDAHITKTLILESKPRLIHRWVQLLKAIYAEPKLKSLVKEFISILLDRDEYDLAMSFTRKLAFIRGFEFVWVLKQIIAKTKDNSRLGNRAANFLIWYSSRSSQNRNRVFKELKSWLPKDDFTGALSAINRFGLIVPIYYFLGQFTMVDDEVSLDNEGHLIEYYSGDQALQAEDVEQRIANGQDRDSNPVGASDIVVLASDQLNHIIHCLLYPNKGLGEDQTETLIVDVGSWLFKRNVIIDKDAGHSAEEMHDIFLALVLSLLSVVFHIDESQAESLNRKKLTLFCQPLVTQYPASRLKFIQQFLKHNRKQLHEMVRGQPGSKKRVEMRTVRATRKLLDLIFSIKQKHITTK